MAELVKSLSSTPALYKICHVAMERSKWEKIMTYFQARARGYLVRSELRRAREDFEEIVMEIDGGLTHLKWTERFISIPRFTCTNDPCLRPVGLSFLEPSEPGLDVSAPLSSASPLEDEAHHCVLLEGNEAERDDSPSVPIRRREEEQKLSFEDGVMESIGRSSSVWNSVELDMGTRQRCLAQNVPRTPEALRLHRNTLTMELVWLQQAIDSRKKYLSLKSRLSVS